MYDLTCPCCGEKYRIDAIPQIGRKVYCGRCRRKHIFYNDKLVPFAFDLSSGEVARRIGCPTCRSHFLININDAGEYSCVACGGLFYVSLKPELSESDLKPAAPEPDPAAIPDAAASETPAAEKPQKTAPPPKRPHPANDHSVFTPIQLPEKAFTGFQTCISDEKALELPTEMRDGDDADSFRPKPPPSAAVREAKRKTSKSQAPVTIKLPENTPDGR